MIFFQTLEQLLCQMLHYSLWHLLLAVRFRMCAVYRQRRPFDYSLLYALSHDFIQYFIYRYILQSLRPEFRQQTRFRQFVIRVQPQKPQICQITVRFLDYLHIRQIIQLLQYAQLRHHLRLLRWSSIVYAIAVCYHFIDETEIHRLIYPLQQMIFRYPLVQYTVEVHLPVVLSKHPLSSLRLMLLLYHIFSRFYIYPRHPLDFFSGLGRFFCPVHRTTIRCFPAIFWLESGTGEPSPCPGRTQKESGDGDAAP